MGHRSLHLLWTLNLVVSDLTGASERGTVCQVWGLWSKKRCQGGPAREDQLVSWPLSHLLCLPEDRHVSTVCKRFGELIGVLGKVGSFVIY